MSRRGSFDIIALSPPGLADPSLAIAASRVGEIGVLDLEYAPDETAAREALARLVRYGRQGLGVKLHARNAHRFARIAGDLARSLAVIVLSPGDPDGLPHALAQLRRGERRILLECTSLAEARAGAGLGVDGVIAKGHEAAGRVGDETTFVLLQRLLSNIDVPVWAQGGIGLHTVAAVWAAGAAGIVLDGQLYLTPESPLPGPVRSRLGAMDGSETTCIGENLGERYRVFSRPGLRAVRELLEEEAAIGREAPSREATRGWHETVRSRVGWSDTDAWLLGQDTAFAAPLARRFGNVAGILRALRASGPAHVEIASALRPLDEGAPLALSHGTRYPIVQGPMTRVSDTAAFAAEVAAGGALPFLALALMRGAQVRALLEETSQRLGARPWGVGILGFVPMEFREEQLAAIRACPPRFALIAGGRPDQARTLESDGIATYLHVPSPGLLKLFLADGARRFVFEGRECGGHVGPRSSFVLWESMIEALLEHAPHEGADAYHVIFAGGIHDAASAAQVSVLAAPLAQRGMRIGVLMGTAYLFTREAVAGGAIVQGFQDEAVRCEGTALLPTGPGHLTRCVQTPYVQTFREERHRLVAEGRSPEEIRLALETLNLGRLRMAAKGIARGDALDDDQRSPFVALSAEEQRARGMYMIGQVAALRNEITSIEALHAEVSVGGSRHLADLAAETNSPETREPARPADIAIVGMSCILPKAPDVRSYWRNILDKVDAITEIPPERWDWRLYYDPDPRAKDKVYSKWGGFLGDVPFEPMSYGMPPSTLASIEPVQLLTLEAVRAALEDAGYLERPFPRDRTAVIIGAGGAGDLGQRYGFRSGLPLLLAEAPEAMAQLDRIYQALPQWTEDSFAGILTNVVAGRVANRFDLGGTNFTVDAACASSLASVYLAVAELEAGTADMVIVGGADTIQSPFAYLCFSKTYALSPKGHCRTFDATADGIVTSEGVGMLVLKRLVDAERDGDRIYAVIKGIAGASDGRDKGLTAPRPEGQVRTLRRAYAKAGVSPATVGLFEAHGTGTVAGDRAELESLIRVLDEAGAATGSSAIGSVKSMIGHTKNTAGVAGLIKATLALYRRVLPPTLGVETPNPRLAVPSAPLYVNTETRPWPARADGGPRRAGVSAFGFGGTNFHAVLEEYGGDYLADPVRDAVEQRPGELFLWRADSRRQLLAGVDAVEQALARGAPTSLLDLALTVYRTHGGAAPAAATLAIVALSPDDLRAKLASAREYLGQPAARATDPRGIYFSEDPLAREGKVALLFPGQGSQHVDMLRDLAVNFAEVRERFETADRVLHGVLPRPLSAYVFPPPSFDKAERQARQEALTRTNVAQPAVGAADLGVFRLLEGVGVRADFMAGHSYGEYVALCAAGVFREEDLFLLSEARGRFMLEGAGDEPGAMAAVDAGPEAVGNALAGIEGVVLANHNAPAQTVIAGARAALNAAMARLKAAGFGVRALPVACAFHSPIVAGAQDKLGGLLTALELRSPRVPVFSNTTAAPHRSEPKAIAAQLVDHVVAPVLFAEEIDALYEAGARIFVEVGPRNTLTGLVGQILDRRPHLAVASDHAGRAPLLQLLHLLGRLSADGVPVVLDRLFDGMPATALDLDRLGTAPPHGPMTWIVNGGRARPAAAPAEPPRLGAAPAGSPRPAAAPVSVPSTAASNDPQAPRSAEPPSFELRPSPAPPAAHRKGPVASAPISGSTPSQPATSPAARVMSASAGAAVAPSDVAAVMHQFQQVMHRFLETQQNVMLAYLNGAPGTATSATRGVSAPLPAVRASVSAPDVVVVPARPALAQPDAPATPDWPVPGAPDGANAAAAVDAESPPAAEAETPTGAALDEATLTRRLLAIVAERTGYPVEMLGLDLDLEADLGIDSIKRIEILGGYRQRWAAADEQQAVSEDVMEKLTTIRTLRGIIEWILTSAAAEPIAKTEPAVVPGEATPPEARQAMPESREPVVLRRYRVAASEIDGAVLTVPAPVAGVLVVTDDERGVASDVVRRLRDNGQPAVLLRHAPEAKRPSADGYEADLSSPSSITDVAGLIRQHHGRIGGLVHLAPLMPVDATANWETVWPARLGRDLKGLLNLARALHDDLRQAARSGGACVLSATAMGGAFGVGAAEFFPGHGGLTGLTKTLAREWADVKVRALDVDSTEAAGEIASRVLAELAAAPDPVEVGYQGSERRAFGVVPAPLPSGGAPTLAIEESWVILVTGGARGVTASVARELARRYRPTLILVGRSPLPSTEESPETARLTDARELTAALVARATRNGGSARLADVEATHRRLLQDREIRATLAGLGRSGARVEYVGLDVRDEAAFAALIGRIYRDYGRLDGVIHGAGVIEDKLIKDKTPASFDRVFDTKVNAALVLARTLRPETLKFLAFFGSVAGTFGNRGQGDYAAANDVLNKLALALDRRWPGRVVSMNWGPWSAGMVTQALGREIASRGVALIPLEAGSEAMDAELRHGRKGDVVVLLSAERGEAPSDPPAPALPRTTPMLGMVNRTGNGTEGLQFTRTLDPARDLYLQDHRLGGKAVLPMAVGCELMAEAAVLAAPGLELIGMREMRVLRGIVIDDGPRTIRITATPLAVSPERVDMQVTIAETDDPRRLHYRAVVELARELPESPPDRWPAGGGEPFPLGVDEAYRRWLFHGPRLQGIRAIHGLSPEGIHGLLAPSAPRDLLDAPAADAWLIDPVIVDGALQLTLLWLRANRDMAALPTGFRRYRRFGSLWGSPLECKARIVGDSGGLTMHADVVFVAGDGKVLGLLEDVEGTLSKAVGQMIERPLVADGGP